MESSTKIIFLAIAILIAVIAISFVMSITNLGKDTFNSANEQLVNNIADMSSTQYDIYNNSTQTGEGVIRLINNTFSDVNIEVLVCTKDGYNFVYNTRQEDTPIYGVTTSIDGCTAESAVAVTKCVYSDKAIPAGTSSLTPGGTTDNGIYCLITNSNNTDCLSNITAKDAAGKEFATGAAVVRLAPIQGNAIKGGTNNGCYDPTQSSNGYNIVAKATNTVGYINSTAYFKTTVQKDINNMVRRITCVQM